MTARWDIFCKVVDNFGDAGVCWRLARQLVREHSLAVRLWIDAPRALGRIAPGVAETRDAQRVGGVEIRRWSEPLPAADAADVVVEAFGCGLPDVYTLAMTRRTMPPAWFVLEYLSAEPWVEGAHGLPSPHPRLPLARRFWFPGFTAHSGGLLRERDLLVRRDAFRGDERARAAFWAALAMPSPADRECRISLFCYPNPGLAALLDSWADGDDPVTCIVPEGVASGGIDAWTGGDVPHPGHPVTRGRLALHAIPFLTQDDYDRLLWSCDVNFVRGEDSFVRAQWAARPFAWHIYPQAEDAHVRKLEAFLDCLTTGFGLPAAAAVRRLHRAWNGVPGGGDLGAAWLEFAAARPQLAVGVDQWCAGLAQNRDLASGLVSATSGEVEY